ncbi:MAG: class I SAM-dependent methyltransferase [Sulfolobales archaeon]
MISVKIVSALFELAGDTKSLYRRYISSRGLKILEVSTGFGINTYTLLKLIESLGGLLVSIDIDPRMIDRARRIFREYVDKKILRLEVADAEKLPYEDNTYDLVVSHTTLHHINNLDKALGEMIRVLKPDGKIIIIDLNPIRLLSIIPGHRPRDLSKTRVRVVRYLRENTVVLEKGGGGVFYYVVASKRETL